MVVTVTKRCSVLCWTGDRLICKADGPVAALTGLGGGRIPWKVKRESRGLRRTERERLKLD